MRKYLIVLPILIVFAGAGFLFYTYQHRHLSSVPQGNYTQAAGTVATSSISTTTSNTTTATPVAALAWNTFESYLSAAKNHDVVALGKLSYKLSSACLDPKQSTECFSRMDSVYAVGKNFKQSDFVNSIYDNRQIILHTDWHLEESDVQIGYGRSVIYFTRDVTGAPKVLFFTQPEEVVYSFIDPNQSHAALVSRLKERIVDSDGDMLEDEDETCSYQGATSSTPPCVPTDPHKMDTNGNGWWDSIETYLR